MMTVVDKENIDCQQVTRDSEQASRHMVLKREGGARSKNGGNQFGCLDSCALPFAFSCLLLSLLPLCLFRLPPFFPTPAARDRPDSLD